MLGVFEALCGGPWIQLYTIEDVYVKRAFAIDPPQVLRLPDRPLPH